MKFCFIILLNFQIIVCSIGQEIKTPPHSISFEGGSRICNGLFGLTYNYRPNFFKRRLEFQNGIGGRYSPIISFGTRIKVIEISKAISFDFGLNYSYNFPNKYIFSGDDSQSYSDTYKVSQTHILHTFISNRIPLMKQADLLINLGYSKNLNKVEVIHTEGSGYYNGKAKKYFDSGILFGFELQIYFQKGFFND